MSWVEAASIPEAFITGESQVGLYAPPPGLDAEQAREAFQALVLVGDIKRGDDVLVHSAASGVGIATIQLARFYGA